MVYLPNVSVLYPERMERASGVDEEPKINNTASSVTDASLNVANIKKSNNAENYIFCFARERLGKLSYFPSGVRPPVKLTPKRIR